MSRYTEHRTLEVGPLLIADSTMESGQRKCWVGAGGLEGRWVTHADFRAIVSALIDFADKLPPVAQPVNTSGDDGSPLGSGARPDDKEQGGSSIVLGAEGEQ